MNDRLCQVVKLSGLTKTAFAQKINVSQGLVSQMCAGITSPSDRTIADICRVFDIQEDWLRYGLEPMRAPKSREEEIAELVGSTLRGNSDFKKSVVRMICSRSDEELRVLESALTAIYEDIQNKEDRD